MYKGIYIALSGAVLKETQMEIIAQNLANADTIGYKRETLSFRDYLMPKDGASPEPDGRIMSYFSSFKTDLSKGNLIRTGNPLDIAIDGDGFIALEGNRYTRRGDLKRDSNGYLTTHDGIRVLGDSGPIKLPEGRPVIDEAGGISVNGVRVGSIRVVDFENPDLRKAGGGVYSAGSGGAPSKATVKQGYLESSNVDVIKEMVHMLGTLREFEAYQKAIHAFDEAASRLTGEMAKI